MDKRKTKGAVPCRRPSCSTAAQHHWFRFPFTACGVRSDIPLTLTGHHALYSELSCVLQLTLSSSVTHSEIVFRSCTRQGRQQNSIWSDLIFSCPSLILCCTDAKINCSYTLWFLGCGTCYFVVTILPLCPNLIMRPWKISTFMIRCNQLLHLCTCSHHKKWWLPKVCIKLVLPNHRKAVLLFLKLIFVSHYVLCDTAKLICCADQACDLCRVVKQSNFSVLLKCVIAWYLTWTKFLLSAQCRISTYSMCIRLSVLYVVVYFIDFVGVIWALRCCQTREQVSVDKYLVLLHY